MIIGRNLSTRMRGPRFAALCLLVLLQLSRSESAEDFERYGNEKYWSTSKEAKNMMDKLESDEVESEQLNEDSSVPHEIKLTPRERLAMEEENRWQRDMEDAESQERQEIWRRTIGLNMMETTEGNYPFDKSDSYDDNQQRRLVGKSDSYDDNQQRRLSEQERQLADSDYENDEALVVIPGLTNVELFAFNAEYADAVVLNTIIDWSYNQVADLSRYRDNFIHVEDLYQFLLKTLNPRGEEIDAEDEQLLHDAVTELRRQQGLVDDEQILYRGFIARGMPLRFLQSLAHAMHVSVHTRRLQVTARDDEL